MNEHPSRQVQIIIQQAVDRLRARGVLTEDRQAQVTRTRSAEHGDFTTNLAMVAAKAEKRSPRELAEALASELRSAEGLAGVEVAGPGFVNVRLPAEAWVTGLDGVLRDGERYGWSEPGSAGGDRVVVEFVSANPTGPLHVGHGRGAVLGDAVVRLLRAAGRDVSAEYYWNDRGRQVRELGRSVSIRLRESERGEAPPEGEGNWYRGDYVKALAAEAAEADVFRGMSRSELAALPEDDPRFVAYGTGRLKTAILATLERLRVRFDHQESERRVAEGIDAFVTDLRARELVKDEEGALFLRTQGKEKDDKDRVIRKSDGEWTYFATDLLYHLQKLERGFGRMINVWGADHHGYVPRMKAGLASLGRSAGALEVLLVQMVNLTSGGKPVKMSKRSGDYVTLEELMDEVGVDATRYVFLTRRHDSQLEFDVDLVKRRSLDNPVFYAQYGHARLSTLLGRAEALKSVPGLPEGARGLLAGAFGAEGGTPPPPAALALPEERDLARRILGLPDLVAEAAGVCEPHRVVYYIQELSQAFQSYYTERWKRHGDPVLPPARLADDALASWDWERTAARLRWIRALRLALRSAFALVGVEPPERMEWSEEGDREDGSGVAEAGPLPGEGGGT